MKVAVSSPVEIDPTPEARSFPNLPLGLDLLARLEGLCAGRGLVRLARRLGDMMSFVGRDLAAFEMEFSQLEKGGNLVQRSAGHLLDAGGKRLRPLCVTLAARTGTGFDTTVADLAVAVELVHNATLLHDDVIDMSETRRGRPTSRSIYGNAASIFAGDWLLVEALRRVRRSGVPQVLEQLFDTIEEMIFAESLQLENRGRVAMDRDVYFRVVEGKTASLFSWAMGAGGRAGGRSEDEIEALRAYGRNIGVAFQAVDDLLDFTGDERRTGKVLFTDLREGKMTFPVIVAMERDPDLRQVIETVVAIDLEDKIPEHLASRVVGSLRRTGAVDVCLAMARRRSAEAVAQLERLPESRARLALTTVAEAIVDRDL